MTARMKPGLIALFAMVVLGVTGVVEACCGTAPTYFITVSVVGKPDCDAGHGMGAVQWNVDYRLPNTSIFAVQYGDGVVQNTDYYAHPTNTPGATSDLLSGSSSWSWQPVSPRQTSRKVRVEFWATVNFADNEQDRALIVFDCTAHGVQNVTVHNQ